MESLRFFSPRKEIRKIIDSKASWFHSFDSWKSFGAVFVNPQPTPWTKINHPRRPVKNTSFDGYKQGKQLRIMTVSNCSSNNPTSPGGGGGGVSGLVWWKKRLCWSCICILFSDRSYRWHPLKMVTFEKPKGTHGGLEAQFDVPNGKWVDF